MDSSAGLQMVSTVLAMYHCTTTVTEEGIWTVKSGHIHWKPAPQIHEPYKCIKNKLHNSQFQQRHAFPPRLSVGKSLALVVIMVNRWEISTKGTKPNQHSTSDAIWRIINRTLQTWKFLKGLVWSNEQPAGYIPVRPKTAHYVLPISKGYIGKWVQTVRSYIRNALWNFSGITYFRVCFEEFNCA